MLKQLKIKNFALLEDVTIDLFKGFTAITGETGSGKSILLDAIGFLFGNRADTSYVGAKSDKCVIEVCLNLGAYDFHTFFTLKDWDYDPETIIRRELQKNGRGRAFVNDSPVLINDLKEFGEWVIDIHGQHAKQLINSQQFYFDLTDALAGVLPMRKQYQELFKTYKILEKKLKSLQETQQQQLQEQEFKLFKIEELQKIGLIKNEQQELEQELASLSNSEQIQEALKFIVHSTLYKEENISEVLKKAYQQLQKIAPISSAFNDLAKRTNQALLELKDIAEVAESLSLKIAADPIRLEWIDQRLGQLFAACKKYGVRDANELLDLLIQSEHEINNNEQLNALIEETSSALNKLNDELNSLCSKLNKARNIAIKQLISIVVKDLGELKMENAQLAFNFKDVPFTIYGNTQVEVMFSANKGSKLELLSKVASGGELSRLMLVFKKQLSAYLSLPTIIFDEIDTGVSGEVANKMAYMLKEMAVNTQVMSITHLPQTTGKAQFHYKVWKEHGEANTQAKIKLLTTEERVVELAQMISAGKPTPVSIANAKELLNSIEA